MKKETKEKNYNECCDHCLQEIVDDAIHCWYVVNDKGIIGWIGCHEFFDGPESYRVHVAKTGGCRWPGDIDNLRWAGSTWEVKEEDDRRRRTARALTNR